MRFRPTYLEKYYGTIQVCRSSVVNKSTDKIYVTSRSGISSPDELLSNF